MAVRAPFVVGTESFDVEEFRVANAATWAPQTNAYKVLTGLKVGPSNPGAVTATGTPDGFTHVAPGVLVVQSSRAANGGAYTLTWDATVDVNHLGGTYGTPANATNPRNDLVIAYIPDTFYGDGNSTPLIRPVIGTPSGSPADPSLAAFPDAVTLARVRVNASATTITTGNITDLRPPTTTAAGGVLPTATATTRTALTGLYDGLTIYRRDRDWIEVYDGAAWRVQGVAVCSSTADITSAITSPYTGQLAIDTSTGVVYRYTGSAWRMATPYRTSQTLASNSATVSFTSIPTTLKTLRLDWTGRSTSGLSFSNLYLRVNNNSGAVYATNVSNVVNTTQTNYVSINGPNVAHVGTLATSTAGSTSNYGNGHVEFTGWDNPHTGGSYLNFRFQSHYYESAGTSSYWHGGGLYFAAGPFNRIDLSTDTGNFVTGSEFVLTGMD